MGETQEQVKELEQARKTQALKLITFVVITTYLGGTKYAVISLILTLLKGLEVPQSAQKGQTKLTQKYAFQTVCMELSPS